MSLNNTIQVVEDCLGELNALKVKGDKRKDERLGLIEERLEKIEASMSAIEKSIVG